MLQVLDGALSDLLQHSDWESWSSDVARASFRSGELETFMEHHARYKQRPPLSGSQIAQPSPEVATSDAAL